jgi:hypothetical protein
MTDKSLSVGGFSLAVDITKRPNIQWLIERNGKGHVTNQIQNIYMSM